MYKALILQKTVSQRVPYIGNRLLKLITLYLYVVTIDTDVQIEKIFKNTDRPPSFIDRGGKNKTLSFEKNNSQPESMFVNLSGFGC